jgi:hypothetical protein
MRSLSTSHEAMQQAWRQGSTHPNFDVGDQLCVLAGYVRSACLRRGDEEIYAAVGIEPRT